MSCCETEITHPRNSADHGQPTGRIRTQPRPASLESGICQFWNQATAEFDQARNTTSGRSLLKPRPLLSRTDQYSTIRARNQVSVANFDNVTNQGGASFQQDDLAVVRWQVQMANDPSLDPWDTIRESQAFWKAPEQQERVELLIKRHGSLTYDDYSPTSTTVSRGLVFGFRYDYDGNPQEPFGPDSH